MVDSSDELWGGWLELTIEGSPGDLFLWEELYAWSGGVFVAFSSDTSLVRIVGEAVVQVDQ